jgi:hypothetical protein
MTEKITLRLPFLTHPDGSTAEMVLTDVSIEALAANGLVPLKHIDAPGVWVELNEASRKLTEATSHAGLVAAIKAMPSPARTLLLIDVVEDSSALGQVRQQLAEATAKLEAAFVELLATKTGWSAAEEKLEAAERLAKEWERLRNDAYRSYRATADKLEAAERDAGRMHYLGNLVRSRSGDEQAELNALMRKYPVRAEPEGVAAPVAKPQPTTRLYGGKIGR